MVSRQLPRRRNQLRCQRYLLFSVSFLIFPLLLLILDRIVCLFFFNIYIDLKSLLKDDHVYNLAAAEAFPLFNKAHVISVEMPNRTGDVSLCLL